MQFYLLFSAGCINGDTPEVIEEAGETVDKGTLDSVVKSKSDYIFFLLKFFNKK